MRVIFPKVQLIHYSKVILLDQDPNIAERWNSTNGVDSIGTQDVSWKVDKLVTFEIAIQTEYL